MPNWKKLLSSGSSGSLSNLVVDNHISASLISGSFYGDGSGLTGIIADGTISGSSQVNITQTEGYSTFSSSIQTYTDAKVSALSSSVDTHLDANISSLSSSAHTQREAIKTIASTANNTLSSSIATALRAEYVAADSALSSSQKTYIDQKVAGVVDSAPATLDTLNELAAALNDDPNFSASIATSIGNRVLTSTFNTYSGSAAGALRTEYKAGDSALSASAHTQRVAIASSIPTNNNQLTNGAGYITGHPSISAASSVNNSGRTYIQDITLDSNGHVTGIASATETVTNTDTNYYLDGITKSGNTLTFSVNGTTNQSYAFGSNAFTSTTIPTNNNQLTNGAGYITGYTETDTFATVTSRGSTSNGSITVNGNNTVSGLLIGGLGASSTGGTTDWNHSTNARPGQGHTLLLGTATNGPGGSDYFHPLGFEYSSKNGSGNITQFAIPYASNQATMYFRGRYGGSWGSWYTMWNSGNDGAGSGLDADLWDGNQFASYLNQAVLTSSSPSFNQVTLTNNGNGTNVRIGDDVWLGDINQANVMSVRGVQSSSAGYISFGNQSAHKLGLNNSSTLTWSSTFSATGDVIAYASSDERLKDNLVPIGNASEKVKQLTGYEFDWNDKQDVYEGHDIGVVAQEVEKVLPEVVTTRDNGYKAVKYEKLVALLIQSNKELIERVEVLEKQLNAK